MNSASNYNGWTNYETWLVNLWLSNDETTYSHVCEMSQDAFAEATADEVASQRERARFALAETLKDYIEEGNPLAGEANLYSDLLNAAMSEVNWQEVAESFLEEVIPVD